MLFLTTWNKGSNKACAIMTVPWTVQVRYASIDFIEFFRIQRLVNTYISTLAIGHMASPGHESQMGRYENCLSNKMRRHRPI
jgi:hypothetical protein